MRFIHKLLALCILCVALGGVAGAQQQDSAAQSNAQVLELIQAGRYTEALPLAESVLAAREKELGPEHGLAGQSLFNLAEIHRALGQAKPAQDYYLRAIANWEKSLSPDEIFLLGVAYNNLGFLYAATGENARAGESYQKALDIYERTSLAESLNTAQTVNNLAELYRSAGQLDRAETSAQRALALYEKLAGPLAAPTGNAVNSLSLIYLAKGDTVRARPLAERAIAIWSKTLGPEHPSTLTANSNLAEIYQAQGDYAQATTLYQKVLAAYEKNLGAEHAALIPLNLRLGEINRLAGRYAVAEPYYRRAIALSEKSAGPESNEMALMLNNLAIILKAQSNFREAETIVGRALAIWEKNLGPEHPNVATAVNNLAEIYRDQGLYQRAEPLLRRTLSIYEKVSGPNSPQTAQTLSNLGLLASAQGQYEPAAAYYQRALKIYDVIQPEPPEKATVLNNIAELYRATGNYDAAEKLYRQSLALYEKLYRPEHPSIGQALNNLGILYFTKGDYEQAETLYRQALAIWEKALGPEHPYVATAVNNLGELYRERGDIARATPLYQRGLAIQEKIYGPEHPDIAQTLNNIGITFFAAGDYPNAEKSYQRALAMYEKTLGPEHPLVSSTLNNLALVYRVQGQYERATPLQLKALALTEKSLGANHPHVATALSNVSMLYSTQGDYARAEPLLLRAIAIYEKAFGPDDANIGETLGQLAVLYEAGGQPERALAAQQLAQAIVEHDLAAVTASGSEKQKQLYLDKYSGLTDIAVSLHTRALPTNDVAAQLALTVILQRKGRALDAMTNQIASLRRHAAQAGPEGAQDAALLDQLAAAQAQYANLQLDNNSRLTPETQRTAEVRLTAEIERLENEIGRRNAEFRAVTKTVSLAAVRQALLTDAALVEIFSYQPFNAKAKTGAERFGAAQYVAYVLLPASPVPQFVVLGDAAQLDEAAVKFRQQLAAPPAQLKGESAAAWQQRLDQHEQQVKETGRQLDEQLWRPVRKLLGPVRRVFLAPDGALNLVPFAALTGEDGRYLVEDYTLNFLTSGRDLLRLHSGGNPAGTEAVIIANPVYDLAATGKKEPAASRRSADFTQFYYPPLPGTALEARALQTLLPDAQVLTQGQATEAALKQVHSPRLLHIATHGFFLSDLPTSAADREARQLGVGVTAAQAAAPRQENALLRSGLVLAGVKQQTSGAGEDGVLTALEAAGLDLFGTKLVVLSACETGLGETRNGEGVYGLRRALVLAGSETQVMSLWQVSDTATRDLMIAYYKLLQNGAGRVEALRQVQLAMIHGNLSSLVGPSRNIGLNVPQPNAPAVSLNPHHPYFWAAFIASGDWQTLAGQEPK